jgi:hypothetical protein
MKGNKKEKERNIESNLVKERKKGRKKEKRKKDPTCNGTPSSDKHLSRCWW